MQSPPGNTVGSLLPTQHAVLVGSLLGDGTLRKQGARRLNALLEVNHAWQSKDYEEGKKRVPSNITLNPLILAVWFMDDGSKSRSACYLNTQQFCVADQELL